MKGITKGLLSHGQIPGPVREHSQWILQALKQFLGRQEFDARCRQFKGQGKPVQPKTDRSYGRCIGSSELEISLDALGALEKECDRRTLGERLRREDLFAPGERQG